MYKRQGLLYLRHIWFGKKHAFEPVGRNGDCLLYTSYTRAGAHCAPLMHQALGTVEQGAVRFSMSYYNTEEEMDQAVLAVREMAESI